MSPAPLTQCLASYKGLCTIKGQNSVNTNRPRHDAGDRVGRQRPCPLPALQEEQRGTGLRGDMQDAKMTHTEPPDVKPKCLMDKYAG